MLHRMKGSTQFVPCLLIAQDIGIDLKLHMSLDTSMQLKASNCLLGPHTVSCRKFYSSGQSGNSEIRQIANDRGVCLMTGWSMAFRIQLLVPIAACQLRSISQRGAM
jgi:hypothetical protein